MPASPKNPSQCGNMAALIAILALAGVLFVVASAMQRRNAVQNCIDSGRRDCVNLPTD